MTGEFKFAVMTILKESRSFAKPAAVASKLMLFVTGVLYIFACVKSFVRARNNQNI